MRNKYSKEFEEEMYAIGHKKTLNELLQIAIKKYNYIITKKQLMQYLYKRNIKYKGYNYTIAQKAKDTSNKKPLFTERTKDDGMVQVKVGTNKWEYKQRYLYSKYHNVKLTSDDYIIFLDHDRTNFDINNLKRITRHESAIMANEKLFSTNKTATETGILSAKLMIKLKEKYNETTNS